MLALTHPAGSCPWVMRARLLPLVTTALLLQIAVVMLTPAGGARLTLEETVALAAPLMERGSAREAYAELARLPDRMTEEVRAEAETALGVAVFARLLDPGRALDECVGLPAACARGALYTVATRVGVEGDAALAEFCSGRGAECWDALAWAVAASAQDEARGRELAQQVCRHAPPTARGACAEGARSAAGARREVPGHGGGGPGAWGPAPAQSADALTRLFPDLDRSLAAALTARLERGDLEGAVAHYHQAAERDGTLNPHRLGHGIGRYLVERGVEPAEAYLRCSVDVTIGCAHEVVIGVTEQGFGSGALHAGDIPRLCARIEARYRPLPDASHPEAQCLHALGHAFAVHFGTGGTDTLARALGWCSPLGPVERRFCWSGVFHSRRDPGR